ncbi:MAG TPA: hypothetical protein VGR29_11775 [Thermomicrobiales bacterium]|nr:hypothetical protein [Thermomicrobiales bacterium]
MDSSTEPVMQPEWLQESPPQRPSYDPRDVLYRTQRFSLVRAHISAFAFGSVLLLVVNLLIGSGSIWAATLIGAWALIVVMHAIIAGIASLILQLLAEDDDIRPASEVRWRPAKTWAATEPPAEPASSWSSPPAPETAPTADPLPDQWTAPPPPPKDTERVSWQTAAQAAWLARPVPTRAEDPSRQPDGGTKPPEPDSNG